jgi:hypothetical protein
VVEVYDWDKTGSNDFISSVSLHLLEIVDSGGSVVFSSNQFIIDQTYSLKTKKSSKNTVLTLRFTVQWPVAMHAYGREAKMAWWRKMESNKIHKVLKDWKIHDMFHMDLCSLSGFDVCLVLDDSVMVFSLG